MIFVEIAASKGSPDEFAGDALVFGAFENEEKGKPPYVPGCARKLDAKIGGVIGEAVKAGEFSGKLNSISVFHVNGRNARLVLLVGLGKRKEFEADFVRQAAGKVCATARELGVKKIGFCVDCFAEGFAGHEKLGKLLTEGAILGLYKFQEYKTVKEGEGKEIESVCLVTQGDAYALAESAKKGENVASAVNITRDICNDPANYATPIKIAEFARGLAKKHGFKCNVLGRKEIAREKMGGLLSVSSGSSQPPAFVVLEYNGAGKRGAKNEKPVVIVGKGITFDSGGISLKPGKEMDRMKFDKAGACAVIGVFVAAAKMNVKKNLVGLVPLAENLPSGSAARPGDIVKTRKGKTIEIESTDAEGRVILADALDYAKEFKPSAIIDLATLTGAVVSALGFEASGLMGNDEKLLKLVEKAGDESGERVWRFPMWKAYDEYNKSNVADIKNMGIAGAGGTIAGGKFLEAFIPEGVPWVHVDIAGTAWNEKPKPYLGLGATGVGVRLISALLEELE